jgi:hypothetical protein
MDIVTNEARQKAVVLFSQMIEAQESWRSNIPLAKQSVRILIREMMLLPMHESHYIFWDDVLTELNNL